MFQIYFTHKYSLNLRLLGLLTWLRAQRDRGSCILAHCLKGKNRSAGLSMLLIALEQKVDWNHAVTLFAFDYGHWCLLGQSVSWVFSAEKTSFSTALKAKTDQQRWWLCRYGKNRSVALATALLCLEKSIAWHEAVTLFAFDLNQLITGL